MITTENKDCILRFLKSSDLGLLTKYANNEKIAQNLRNLFPSPYTREDAERFYRMLKENGLRTNYVIEYQHQLAGMIGLQQLDDIYCKTAEIGYWIAEPYWNMGIATSAVKAIVEWAWINLDIVRIHTGIISYNKASARVLEKAGFTFECEYKNSIYKKGILANELRYSILKPLNLLAEL